MAPLLFEGRCQMRLALALVAFCSTLPARSLLVSLSGTYNSSVPSTTYLAPNKPWSLTFNVDSNPAVLGSDPTQSGTSAVTNINYTLNGVPVTVIGDFFAMGTL